jgi:hypothetical protein
MKGFVGVSPWHRTFEIYRMLGQRSINPDDTQ